MNTKRPYFLRRLAFAIPVLLFLAAWEGGSRLWPARMALCPPPSLCFLALVKWAREEDMAADLLASGKHLFLGLGCGAIVGVLTGLLTGRSRAGEAALTPLILLFRPLPPVALIPLFIVWFGIGEGAKVFAIAFAVFFPVWLNTFSAVRQIPQRLLWSAGTLTRSSWRIFLGVIAPAALPGILTGVRLGISAAFIMVFVAELMGTDVGIGYKISIWQLAYRMDAMIAALVVLGAGGALCDWLFTRLMWWRFPWLRLIDRGAGEASRPSPAGLNERTRTPSARKAVNHYEHISG